MKSGNICIGRPVLLSSNTGQQEVCQQCVHQRNMYIVYVHVLIDYESNNGETISAVDPETVNLE